MKKVSAVISILLLMVVVAFSIAAEKGKPDVKAKPEVKTKPEIKVLKVGDEQYVCNCGEKCACNTISMNQGKCTCGSDMVKAKVVKVEKGKANFKAEGWQKERAFKTVGKYTCDCSPDCKCGTISQNPGKCTCGSDLKKI